MNNKTWIGIGIVIIVALAFFFFSGSSGSGGTGNVVSAADSITIPLSEISSQASWQEYQGIKYFVVKTSDGSIKAAFDACDVCGGTKGYKQEGNDMVCNNCGRHFDIDQLGSKNIYGGGCWPGYLPSEIQGENLVIKKSDLEAGNYVF